MYSVRWRVSIKNKRLLTYLLYLLTFTASQFIQRFYTLFYLEASLYTTLHWRLEFGGIFLI